MVVPASDTADQTASVPDDPADRAFDGGGLVTPDAPTGNFTGQGVTLVAMTAPPADRGVAAQALVAPAAMLTHAPAPIPAPAMLPRGGGWAIQVGAFPDAAHSQAVIAAARARAADLLAATQPAVIPVQRGGTLYRARLVGLSAATAATACARLVGTGMDCFPVPPGS
jgi:cell division septation protein DedD